MPLYTYISSFQGSQHAEQGRYSNFKGFASGASSEMPEGALPGLTPRLREEMGERANRCKWEPVPNRRNVWRTAISLGGSDLVVHVVQTEE